MVGSRKESVLGQIRRAAEKLWGVTVLLSCLPLVLSAAAGALSIDKQFDQLGRSWWNRTDGLPQNAVLAIARTDPGYLWIGTQEGLVRFDGERMRLFDAQNVDALKGSFVTSLADGGDGRLWIGTRSGLVLYDGEAFEAVNLQGVPGLARPYVRALLVDRGALWIGLSGGGLLRLETATGQVARFDEVPADAVVRVLFVREGRLWIGTAEGLFQVVSDAEGDSVTPWLIGRSVRAAAIGPSGGLWLGLENGELLTDSIDEAPGGAPHRGLRFTRSHEGLGSVSDLMWDREGRLWVATSLGVFRLDDRSRVEALTEVEPDAAPGYALFQDEAGSMWIGTRSGLLQLRDGSVTVFGARQGLADPFVRVALEDEGGRLWVGTRGGLSVRPAGFDGSLRRVALPPTVSGVRALASQRFPTESEASGATEVWLGTRSQLMVGRAPDAELGAAGMSWRAVQTFEAPINSIAVEAEGVVAGTQGAGVFVSSDRGVSWGVPAGDAAGPRVVRVVRRIELGPLVEGGAFWIGSEEGLFVLPEATAALRQIDLIGTSSDGEPVEEQPIVLDVVSSRGGGDERAVWIGTAEHGLGMLSDTGVHWFRESDGLFDDLVFRILDDGRGSLWLTSNRGVSRVSIVELEEVVSARARNERVPPLSRRWLDESDGFLDAECNGGSQPAGWVDSEGDLWVPTARGLARFDPGAVDDTGPVPRVWIERVLAGRSRVAQAGVDKVELSPGGRSLRVEYASASYLSSSQSRFEVRLEGLNDGAWQDVGSQRSVDYGALPPGEYDFQVRAVSRFGTRSPAASVRVNARPLLWERRWFLPTVVFLAALLGLLLGRLRVQALRQRERQLKEQVAERTEDLAQANRELERLATIDPLTGVANQRRLWAELPKEWSRASRTATPLGCLMVDLDQFKRINDRHGHQRGDAALQRVAGILSTQVRREGELVGRSGGDEFVVIIPGADLEEAVRVGDRICNQVAASGEALAQLRGEEAVHVTVSVGAASCVPRAEVSPETLLEAADRALYRAKEAGRNTVSN